jgi:hypothetical protein
MYKVSKPDEKNVLKASLGVSTIGSPERLKLVLIIIGALLRFSKFDKISYKGCFLSLTVKSLVVLS